MRRGREEVSVTAAGASAHLALALTRSVSVPAGRPLLLSLRVCVVTRVSSPSDAAAARSIEAAQTVALGAWGQTGVEAGGRGASMRLRGREAEMGNMEVGAGSC